MEGIFDIPNRSQGKGRPRDHRKLAQEPSQEESPVLLPLQGAGTPETGSGLLEPGVQLRTE